MIGTALLGICAYTLLLFSIVTPTQLERTVRGLRAVPNDFVQESNTKKEFITAGDEKIIVDTIAAVDGLRFEFNRQQQETPVGWMEWLSAPLSLARDALPVSSARKYPSCGLSEADKMRYTSLKRGGRIFIAINLLDNEELMPTLTRELLALLRELGPDRFFVSIYENGSMDLTVMQLRLLCKILDTIGTPYRVVARGMMELQQKENGHRISRLSLARNIAMEPLIMAQNSTSSSSSESFETLLFLNDVFHCHGDVLELLLQKRRNQAVQACGLDSGPRALIYDRWVLRTMRGGPFYRQKDLIDFFAPPDDDMDSKPRPQILPEVEDTQDRHAYEAGNPFQVFSCWNGVTAFSADAFAPPTSLRFRTAHNDPDSKDGVTDKASECYLSSVDLWKAGLGRIIVVPRTRVGYSLDVYEADRASSTYGPASGSPPLIGWSTTPPGKVVMHDFAQWYAPETEEPWDEA
ncbi:Alpha-1,3-mannosyltransferase CMT1 [Ceratobasidium theobromae]|uniref:Alpha-1,3-mannosyltransferase CMT1 n=1 Tax=Ceratobasidium theobromae TaxID=1582974 RepID=A0A5N5QKQ3_9AGAM|nr:Alpha-1,3-mannosyltransferase CMT1 [Ceratobasidium theobromae]